MKEDVLANFDKILLCIKSEFSAVRHMAAKAVAALTLSKTGEYMNHILDDVLPLLGASHLTCWRQGAIETIYRILLQIHLPLRNFGVLSYSILHASNSQISGVRPKHLNLWWGASSSPTFYWKIVYIVISSLMLEGGYKTVHYSNFYLGGGRLQRLINLVSPYIDWISVYWWQYSAILLTRNWICATYSQLLVTTDL